MSSMPFMKLREQMFVKQIVHIILWFVTDQKSYLSIIEPIYLWGHTLHMDEFVISSLPFPLCFSAFLDKKWSKKWSVCRKHTSVSVAVSSLLVSVVISFVIQLNNMVIYKPIPNLVIHLPMSIRLSSFKGLKDYTPTKHSLNQCYTPLCYTHTHTLSFRPINSPGKN